MVRFLTAAVLLTDDRSLTWTRLLQLVGLPRTVLGATVLTCTPVVKEQLLDALLIAAVWLIEELGPRWEVWTRRARGARNRNVEEMALQPRLGGDECRRVHC